MPQRSFRRVRAQRLRLLQHAGSKGANFSVMEHLQHTTERGLRLGGKYLYQYITVNFGSQEGQEPLKDRMRLPKALFPNGGTHRTPNNNTTMPTQALYYDQRAAS